ncbi:DUF1707 SHOCT-like domain-containing protein [Micromonospora sp. SCSIO 07396]|uniref:DUF1707 SHOCT-like domain-containing protein n=1 Tax=Micromonospora sp. AKA109 TaxID=2733865 RepID=UPI002491E65E|nr:DUF1707 domain-containing protein [Micromonospora sp. AKA109]
MEGRAGEQGRDRMRAADADREATAERLRVALEEGRLDLHEYDERLQQTYGAKTYAELDTVLVDLPRPASAQRSALTPRGPQPPPVSGPGASVPGGEVPPGPPVTGETAVGKSAPTGAAAGRWPVAVWGPWLRVAALLTAIWAISSVGSRELLFYWPVWALGPWGVLLLFRTTGGFAGAAPARDRRRAARATRRRRRRPDR